MLESFILDHSRTAVTPEPWKGLLEGVAKSLLCRNLYLVIFLAFSHVCIFQTFQCSSLCPLVLYLTFSI